MRHPLLATTGLMLLLSACGQTPSAYQPSAAPGDQARSAHMHNQLGSQALGDCTTDSARGGAAVASSVENFNTPARAAFDGDPKPDGQASPATISGSRSISAASKTSAR